jgi:hypothetical protein
MRRQVILLPPCTRNSLQTADMLESFQEPLSRKRKVFNPNMKDPKRKKSTKSKADAGNGGSRKRRKIGTIDASSPIPEEEAMDLTAERSASVNQSSTGGTRTDPIDIDKPMVCDAFTTHQLLNYCIGRTRIH